MQEHTLYPCQAYGRMQWPRQAVLSSQSNFVVCVTWCSQAMFVDFGLAQQYGGSCYLRFDDTNPEAEKQEFIDHIQDIVAWLGWAPWKVSLVMFMFMSMLPAYHPPWARPSAGVLYTGQISQPGSNRRKVCDTSSPQGKPASKPAAALWMRFSGQGAALASVCLDG